MDFISALFITVMMVCVLVIVVLFTYWVSLSMVKEIAKVFNVKGEGCRDCLYVKAVNDNPDSYKMYGFGKWGGTKI